MDKNQLTWKDIRAIDYAIREADSELSYKDGEEKKMYELALKKFNNGEIRGI